MVFHGSLDDSKFLQVSWTLLSILADFVNAVVWIASTRPLISNSFRPFFNPTVTVPRAPNKIGIKVTFMFHNFLKFPIKVAVLIFLFTFFLFFSVVSRGGKVHNFASSLFFLLIIIRSGCLAKIRSKSLWSLCVSFTRTATGLSMYHLFVWLNLNFLYNSQWITLPTLSCIVLYSFYANLLHSLIM